MCSQTEFMPVGEIPISTEYDFNQLVAEAVVRIGQPAVADYLKDVAAKVGWPIPARDRFRVGAGLALLVQAHENGLD